jgi:DUF971 family protein
MTTNPAIQPTAINADRTAGLVTIDWADSHRSRYSALSLRWLCPCAFCRGEAGTPGWLDSMPTLTPEQTQLVAVRLVGTYAIAPTWADGHDTGYYTFEALRRGCTCDRCTADRQSTTKDTQPTEEIS